MCTGSFLEQSDPKPLPSSGRGFKLKGNFIFHETTILKGGFFFWLGSLFMCKITISNFKKNSKSCSRLQSSQETKDQRPTVNNSHVKKIQNWIWNWEYNKFTRVTSTLVMIYFVENLSLVEISKIEYETGEYNKIYKYNIHIGYDIFCWKLSLWLISFTRINSSNFVFTYRNKSGLFEMWTQVW